MLAFVVAFFGAVIVPAANAAVDRQGLKGEYFTLGDGFSLDELKATVVDGAIDYQNMVPIYEQRTGQKEQAGVRWSGNLQVPADGDYTFDAVGDNGFRLWVDGELLIDFWEDKWDIPQQSDPVALTAGAHDFKFELFQNDGGAHINLAWSSDDLARETIPAEAFTLPDDYEGVTANLQLDASGTVITGEFDGELDGTVDPSQLTISTDGTPIDVTEALVDEGLLHVSTETEIQTGVNVRLGYDGAGSLAIAGTEVEAFDLPVFNGSEYTMRTPWADDIDPNAPLAEYPRPQLVRDQWQNLNGQWQFEALASGEDAAFGQDYSEQVVVPYPIESQLSGIERHEDDFAYRRTFEVPAEWGVGDGNRLQLQFGAVDYESWIYVNGVEVGHHKGGYDAFTLDITDALQEGSNELVVKVHDSTTNVVRGKQEVNPSGIFYTPSSGIWQTVWMEPVPEAAVSDLELTPDLDSSSMLVTAEGVDGVDVTVSIWDNGEEVGTETGVGGEEIAVPIADPKLWSPEDPFLYDITVTAGADTLTSYAGMRSIEVAEVDGLQRILLNGEQTFLLSTLDQGYWPDGVSTAPTDEALRWDIEQTKELGFNTIRKHIKVEPARWYYHADQLGMMVWQDMPSNNGGNADEETRAQFEEELDLMIDDLDSFTSIIGWVPFNEGWGEWEQSATGRIADHVGQLDESRIVNAHSGVNCCNSKGDSGKGDIIDWHMYVGPALPQPDSTRASMDGEHGGFSLSIPGHVWPGGSVNPYGEVDSIDELTQSYVDNTAVLLKPAQNYLSGSVYTQITDVEGEVNGFWTYDRKVLKMHKDQVFDINQQVIAAGAQGAEPAPEPETGELAHWAMDEGEGSESVDLTGNDRTLQLGDGVTWTDEREREPAGGTGGGSLSLVAEETADDDSGSALQFDGESEAVADVPVIDTNASFTVASWVRLDELPESYATFVSADGVGGSSTFFLQYGTPINGFGMSFPDGPRAVLEIEPELGTWYHLVGVYDAESDTLQLYVDGELTGEAGEATNSSTTDGTIVLGRGQWQNNKVDYLNGALDDVHVWGNALSADEIAELFADESTEAADPEPTDPEPTDPEPTDPEPTEPEPTDPQPTEPEPTAPQPSDPGEPGEPGDGDDGAGSDLPETGQAAGFGVLVLALALMAGGAFMARRRMTQS